MNPRRRKQQKSLMQKLASLTETAEMVVEQKSETEEMVEVELHVGEEPMPEGMVEVELIAGEEPEPVKEKKISRRTKK